MYILVVEHFLRDRLDRRRMGHRPLYTIVNVAPRRAPRLATFDSIVFLQGRDVLLVSLCAYGDWYRVLDSPAIPHPR
jgi:hypothetical protein